MHPANFHTPVALFILIVAGYLLLSLFVLGAKKVYFDPYSETDEPSPPAPAATTETPSLPPTL